MINQRFNEVQTETFAKLPNKAERNDKEKGAKNRPLGDTTSPLQFSHLKQQNIKLQPLKLLIKVRKIDDTLK